MLKKCPKCGSEDIAKIVYGLICIDEKMQADLMLIGFILVVVFLIGKTIITFVIIAMNVSIRNLISIPKLKVIMNC